MILYYKAAIKPQNIGRAIQIINYLFVLKHLPDIGLIKCLIAL